MPIYSMAFGASREGEDGKREAHFRAAYTNLARTYEEAKRVARLHLNLHDPLDQGWGQHTIDVHEIPTSWCIQVARDVILRGAQSEEQKRRAQAVFEAAPNT